MAEDVGGPQDPNRKSFSHVAAETLLLFLTSLSLFFPILHSHSVTRVTMNITTHAILGQTFWVDYNNNPVFGHGV